MTPTQLSTLKAAALTDAMAMAFITSGNDTGLAEWFNAPTNHIVWRSVLTPDQARAAIIQGAAQLDALTASKRDSLLWWVNRSHDARLATTQAAMADLCGSQNTLKNALLDGAKRNASVLEKIFATGTGTTAAPGTSPVMGAISWSELLGL